MSKLNSHDICIFCPKIVKECHKNISCKICNGFIHKKCTKLKPKQLKTLDSRNWECQKCQNEDIDKLNKSPEFNVKNLDLEKYDNMIFNPLRFEAESVNKAYNDVVPNDATHSCSYVTPKQFNRDKNVDNGTINLLNVNIRSISKIFDSFKECLKDLDCEFTAIGITESHLKDPPKEYYRITGYNIEYTNRINRDKVECAYTSAIR